MTRIEDNDHQTEEITDQTEETNLEDEFHSISLETSHSLYLHPSDHPGLILVSTVFNGENFNEWKRSMSLALSAKNKLGFVTGKFKIPSENSKYFDHWQRCNDIIITWILNSNVPEIRSSLVFIPLVVDVWNDIHTRYTQSNGPRIFELKQAMSALHQETMSVSTYYTKFKMLWDDFVNVSNIHKCICLCTCKAKAQNEQYDELMKVTQFLMGLNELYTNIRGQLLMMNPMPKLTQVLALLQ
ncbi:uncharacterized protein LOC141725088 [Apium graveolens]|uniref:uncharacterized protein LOC141725088 n=1 Tax=Apium graveolens TaxID=4045 RepID=UPI003D79EBAE